MQLQFKYERLRNEWVSLDFRLREIILPTFQLLCAQYCRPTIVATSIYREDGVHSAWRAVDIRNPWLSDLAVAEGIATWINDRFAYGRTGAGVPTNVCIVGKFDPRGRHNDHFHFQVPGPYYELGSLSVREVM
jgi:hypothetical protein